MPRSTEEILAHANELAKRFEEHEPGSGDLREARALRDVAQAFARVAASEQDLAATVAVARAEGHSWAAIGAMLGTSGEAARQRYGTRSRTGDRGQAGAQEIGEHGPRRRASA
jgi:hypothetical protein